MEYKPVQKKNSSWTPTPVQKKGKSPGKMGHSSIQPKSNPSSAPSPEIREYSRASADRLAANVMRGIQAKKQEEAEGSTLQRKSESPWAPTFEPPPPLPQSPASQLKGAFAPVSQNPIQRQCADCANQEKEQAGGAGKDLKEIGIQTKLTVGAPGDAYEQEADRVASQVMSMSAPPDSSASVQRQLDTNHPHHPKQIWKRAQSITPVVHRQIDPRVQMRQMIQRAHQIDGNQASGDLESRLNASKGGGSPLSDGVRGFMEPRFGADFSGVRVHTGGEAVQMNQELGAQAFTHGSDVYFGQGKEPGNNELTAHELTHVVQQTGGVQRNTIQCSRLDDYGNPDNPEHDPSKLSDADIQATDDYKYLQQRFFPQQSPSPESVEQLLLACRLALRYMREHRVCLVPAYLETFFPKAEKQLAVTTESEAMLGEEMTWVPSGPGSGNTFETWASASSETTAPKIDPSTTINCWEMVLLAAYNAGMVSWQRIHDIYTANASDWYGYLVQALSGSGAVPYTIGDPETARPLRGDIVFFNGAAHVALANGVTDGQGRTEIISFWPPPDKGSYKGTIDRVKTTTIEELVDYMTPMWGAPDVTFATSPW